MKKLLLLAVALLLTSTTVNAQQYDELPKNEFSVSYGYAPLYWMVDQIGEAFAVVIAAPFRVMLGEDPANIKIEAKKCFGVINFDYVHHISPKTAWGVNLSYSRAAGDYIDVNTQQFKDAKLGEKRENYFTIMPTVKLEWFRRKNVSMYSRFSVGLLLASKADEYYPNTDVSDPDNPKTVEGATETEFKVYPMAQISPFGVEAGSEHIRGFLELGVGQAGLLQLGVRTRF